MYSLGRGSDSVSQQDNQPLGRHGKPQRRRCWPCSQVFVIYPLPLQPNTSWLYTTLSTVLEIAAISGRSSANRSVPSLPSEQSSPKINLLRSNLSHIKPLRCLSSCETGLLFLASLVGAASPLKTGTANSRGELARIRLAGEGRIGGWGPEHL